MQRVWWIVCWLGNKPSDSQQQIPQNTFDKGTGRCFCGNVSVSHNWHGVANSLEGTRCRLSKMAQGLQTWYKDHKYNCGEPGMCEQEWNMQLAGRTHRPYWNQWTEPTGECHWSEKSPAGNKCCQVYQVERGNSHWGRSFTKAVVSLKLDYQTHLYAQGLVGIVYEAKQETGGVLVCCEHGVITHEGSKGKYLVPYDKYKIVAQRDATIPTPPELQTIHDMVLAGKHKPENRKGFCIQSYMKNNLIQRVQWRGVRGANAKMVSAPRCAGVKDKGIGATVDALVMGVVVK